MMEKPKKIDLTKLTAKQLFTPIIIAAVVILMLLTTVKVTIADDSVTAKATLTGSTTVLFSDIESVELESDIELGTRTVGVGSITVRAGSFSNGEFGAYKLYSFNSCSEYVVVKHTGGTLVFNARNAEKTEAVYNELLEAVK